MYIIINYIIHYPSCPMYIENTYLYQFKIERIIIYIIRNNKVCPFLCTRNTAVMGLLQIINSSRYKYANIVIIYCRTVFSNE